MPVARRGGEPDTVQVPAPDGLVHLQFRRYAGCPICNLHLRGFAVRYGELAAAGVEELAVFHSDATVLAAVADQLPFRLVPDPQRRLYRDFAVGTSWRAITHPRAWLAAGRGWRPGLPAGDGSGHLGLPADFLIAPDGRLISCYYGRHADDHWSVDQVLALAGQA